jgi:hypothetical protein
MTNATSGESRSDRSMFRGTSIEGQRSSYSVRPSGSELRAWKAKVSDAATQQKPRTKKS